MKKNKVKKSNSKSTVKGSIILIVLFTLIIIAASFLIANSDFLSADSSQSTTPEVNVIENDETDDNLAKQSPVKAKGFPVSFTSNSIKDVQIADSCIFVLNQDMISCINNSGSERFSEVVNYVDPVMKTNGQYCLIFDRQGSKYMILNKKGIIRNGNSENEALIITGEIAEDGSYIISSGKVGATSMMTYYSKNGDMIYQWSCANEHIISLAISDNKKNLACCAINSSNGNLYTRIYFFDINSSEKNKHFTFKTSAALDLFFTSNSSIIAVCNNKRILIDCKSSDSKPISVEYPSTILARSNDANGNTAVISKKIDSFDESELSVYDNKNNLVYSCSVDNGIIDIICNRKKVYILTKSNILVYNSSGKLTRTIEINSPSIGIAYGFGKLHHFSQGYLFSAVSL